MADRVLGGSSPAVSRATLEATVGKASQFLFTLPRAPTALNALRKVGYSYKVHKRGWELLNAATQPDLSEAAANPELDDALTTLDDWDERGIAITRAALTQFPEIRDVVLAGIQPIAGPAAALNVETILGRLASLEDSARTRAALARLAESGLDAATRKELGRLVKIAKGSKAFDDALPPEGREDTALLALRDWYYEWSEIARQVVTRREHLIRLGLAERRANETPREPEEDNDIVVEDPTPFLIETPATPDKPQ